MFVIAAEAEDAQAWLLENHPELTLMSAGRSIEIYKEADLPTRFVERFALHEIAGTHALGHTRMATESRVTTAGSHPFSTGLDLCLVHNGSLSNHNRLRRTLQREGMVFRTENDSEVAAGIFDVAFARGGFLGGGTRRDAWTIWTVSTRSRSGRRTGSRCCATRSRASRR